MLCDGVIFIIYLYSFWKIIFKTSLSEVIIKLDSEPSLWIFKKSQDPISKIHHCANGSQLTQEIKN